MTIDDLNTCGIDKQRQVPSEIDAQGRLADPAGFSQWR